MAELERQLGLASARQAVGQVSQLGAEYKETEAELNEALAAWTIMVE